MADITIFQCLPSYKAHSTNRVVSGLKKLNCRILLDLEDSIRDVITPEKSTLLKQQARTAMAAIFALNPGFKFDIRINSPHSDEYKNDMALLTVFISNVRSIFIPKIEYAEDIRRVVDDTGASIKANPIFETLNGIKNKERICVPEIRNMVEFFFYGNYDFHLDANIFPIHEQYTDSYWKTVESLVKTIENGFHFGNSPYSAVSDMATLRYSLFKLNSICKKDFAVMSLHKNQTLEYMKLQPCKIHSVNSFPSNAHTHVIDTYVSGKLKGRSFAIDKGTNKIITPQEYLLAINHDRN